MSSLSAYIHVPFCRRKCNYCDFYSAPPSPGAVSSYVRALVNQIRTSRAAGASLHTVYVGGGTPSLLSEQDLFLIVSALNETFDLSRCAEFTLECNPESVTGSLASAWRSFGIDRISMGVQSFQDELLSRLGRLHTGAQARKAYGIVRTAGFENVSLDLMAALPDQTAESFRSDLTEMLALSPEHLSVYLLKIEPNSSFGMTGVSERDEDFQRCLYLLADRTFTHAGYEHYEISNFAKPGKRALHNSIYWTGGEYLAFGPGASGYFNGLRYRIEADIREYCARNGAVSPIPEGTVDSLEARKESVLLGLRLSDGIDGKLIPPDRLDFARSLCSSGLARWNGSRFSLTAEGFLVSDYIISRLLPER